jgi:pimeloyl-ACP methyl ester carboxylesterase
MSTTVKTGAAIRPLHVEFPEEAIDDQRRRVAATRWPSKARAADRSQGMQRATSRALACYWREETWKTPRSWVEASYPNVIYVNEVDKGGHFAAWEEPELFSTEICAAFRSLRQGRFS